MISIITGKRNSAFEKKYAELTKKSSVEFIDAGSESFSSFFDQVQTPSLFGEQKTFVVRELFSNDDAKKMFFDHQESLEQAPHDVIILTDSILAPDLKKLESFITVHKIADDTKKESAFNTFALANTFAMGDRKKTWLMFMETLVHDDEMEKLHGMIWWKLKDMMQKKSVFSKQQLQAMAKKLVAVYHESRLGGLDMQHHMEEFFLTMPEIKK